MKNKTCSFFVSVLSLVVLLHPQIGYTQTCQWARTASDSSMEPITKGVATDPSGNVFVTGYFWTGTMHFGSAVLTTVNSVSQDIYLAKYDSSGNVLWAKSFGGSFMDRVIGMTSDNAGNVYLTGFFESDTVYFGTDTIINNNYNEVFLAKFDGNGNLIWLRTMYDPVEETNNGANGCITQDNMGGVYFTGSFLDSIKFGSITYYQVGGASMFTAKYNTDGDFIWAQLAQGGEPYGITSDRFGNVFVTGSWDAASINFGGHTLTDTNSSDGKFFLAKYNTNGNAMWVQGLKDSLEVTGETLCTDDAGNVYIAGVFSSPTLVIGSTILINADPSGTTDDIFLVKYDSLGSLKWAERFGGNNQEFPFGMVCDANNDFYLCGFFSSPTIVFGSDTLNNLGLFITKCNSTGAVSWAKQASVPDATFATTIALDNFGHLFCAGIVASPGTLIDTCSLTVDATYAGAAFVARFGNIAEGIHQIAAAQNITLYPNPTSGTVHILQSVVTDGETPVLVTNYLGKAIYNGKIQFTGGSSEFKLNNALPGLYFVTIGEADKKNVFKVLVEK